MTGSYIALSYWDVALAAIFLVLNGVLSLLLGLRLERRLAIAAARMIVQLFLVGLVLKTVFAIASPWLTLAIAFAMVAFAGREIRARQERRLNGIWGYSLGAGPMMLAGMIVTVTALTTQIGPDPWWSPRYALPLFGMILGNAMTGISLALDTLNSTVHRERPAIEAQLLLGYHRFEALAPCTRRALRSGFMPIINSMAATGIVALPGMMTGQILSGVDPTEAVKYQVLVMFLIGGSTGLGVLGAVLASIWRLTDNRHRLRLDRLGSSRGPG
ncbi:MAG: iron export ABC transporter permease subunit FetB [Hyphomicrobiales bacterium]|nr:iron export ABC transporter permease subunit FetB [Hyphomicrobiales bacterium]